MKISCDDFIWNTIVLNGNEATINVVVERFVLIGEIENAVKINSS